MLLKLEYIYFIHVLLKVEYMYIIRKSQSTPNHSHHYCFGLHLTTYIKRSKHGNDTISASI